MNTSPVPSPDAHLDARAIYALLDGRLEPAVEHVAEAHIWRCGACRSLREECAALLSSLRWYAADPPAPPDGYWDELWRDLALSPRSPSRRRGVTATLALAASLALLLVTQPGDRPVSDGSPAVVSSGPVAPSPRWTSEYRLFEQASATIGSVDPLSKGIVLASLSAAD